jgi:hypothetical protein
VPVDTQTPQSAGWWLNQLGQRLDQRTRGARWSPTARGRRDSRPGLDLLDDYLRGDPPLPAVSLAWREALLPLVRESRMNYAELVVSAVLERMIPLGWTTAVDADESGDEIAARISAANQLELRCADTFRLMLSLGSAYGIVGAPDPDTGVPVVSCEDPREVITADDPATGVARAALKLFRDEWTGDELAYVFLPGFVAVARRPNLAGAYGGFFGQAWDWDARLSAVYPDAFSDLVPVVHFRNRDGRGEYEPHLDVLDRINSEIFRRVTVAAYQAFRQRAMIGAPQTTDDLPLKADRSNEIDYSEILVTDPGAVWQLPSDVEFKEFGAIDLGPIRAAVKDDVQALAAVTRTPLFYITPDAAAGSAEGASVQREGLVYRTEDRRRRADAPLARVMSIAMRMMGETERSEILSIRTLWQPAERYSLAERASAAAQLKGILPASLIARDVLQYRPEDLPLIERERDADLARAALEAELLAPPPAPVTPAAPAAEPEPAGAAA